MIRFQSKYRSQQKEVMDDFDFQGKEMSRLLNDLNIVNKWLGGNKITLTALSSLIRASDKKEIFSIIDIGCGDGEILRLAADKMKDLGIRCSFTGIDANTNILDEAIKRSSAYGNIQYISMNIFSEEFEKMEYDIALFTLFLHHFNDDEIVTILKTATSNAKVGIIVNDLERNQLAFILFKIFGNMLLSTKTARSDGLISVCRAFKKMDLNNYAARIDGIHRIKWKWAFRYQWIIKKL